MKRKLVIKESQIKNLKLTLLEEKLRSYIFDWDDNILYMPTTIKMDKKEGSNWVPVDVSTEEFALVRTNPDYRLRNNDPNEAFKDFKVTDSFLRDTKEAIHQNKFAPSANKFKEALIYGNHFGINTARGHKPEALKQGVKLFINMVLTRDEKETMINNIRENMLQTEGLTDEQVLDMYLDEMGEYYPVSSEEFGERFGLETSGGAANPEHAKKVAIEHFVRNILKNARKLVSDGSLKKMSVGFSDDDIRNVKAVEEFIEDELNHIYPEFHFVVYDTSEKGKKKMVIEKQPK
jgi:hypothetical protein